MEEICFVCDKSLSELGTTVIVEYGIKTLRDANAERKNWTFYSQRFSVSSIKIHTVP